MVLPPRRQSRASIRTMRTCIRFGVIGTNYILNVRWKRWKSIYKNSEWSAITSGKTKRKRHHRCGTMPRIILAGFPRPYAYGGAVEARASACACALRRARACSAGRSRASTGAIQPATLGRPSPLISVLSRGQRRNDALHSHTRNADIEGSEHASR